MRTLISRALAYVAAERSVAGPAPSARLPSSSPAPRLLGSSAARRGLSGPRLRKFLSYYRPHVGLLLADLGCAVLVSATTLALPLLANYVVKRLTAGAGPALMPGVWGMGALML